MTPVFKEISSLEDFKKTIPLHMELNGGDPPLTEDHMCREFLRAQKHGYRQFAFYIGEKIIGIFSLTLRYSPSYFAPGCELNGLIVVEEYRSQGIGKQIMAFAENWACENGAGFMRMFVYPKNMGAMDFYARQGYRHTSNYMYKTLAQDIV